MFNNGKLFAALTAGIVALACDPSWATTYKWVDEKGEVHYGDKIPPEYAGKSNTEIGKSGVTLKKNEGQLTPEQLKARAAEQKKKDDDQQKALEVQRRNKALLTTYGSVQEIDVAREKHLKQAEDTIRGIQQKIADTQARQVQLQKDASSYKGKKLPAELQTGIDDADKDLRSNQQLVVSKRKELDAIRAKYEEERRVYLELTGGTDSATASDGKSK